MFVRGLGRSAVLVGSIALPVVGFLAACSATTLTPVFLGDDGGGDGGGLIGNPQDGGSASDSSTPKDAGTDSAKGKCDADDADCVACGSGTCNAPDICCYGTDGTATCGSASSCTTTSKSACDGNEDCAGSGKCCVRMSASSTKASGTSECASSCTLSNGSTGTGSSVSSQACHVKSDCAGVTGQFGVPYSECCRLDGYDVGVCLSQTFAGEFENYGGRCN